MGRISISGGSGGGSATVLFSDNFNRANGPLGASWSTVLGAGAVIVSNRAQAAAFGAGYFEAVQGFSFPPDQFAQAALFNTSAGHVFAPSARLSGSGATLDGYCVIWSESGTPGLFDWIVRRLDDGVGTNLLTGQAAGASGDLFGIICVGTTIQATHNGVLVPGSAVVDATYATGVAGFGGFEFDAVTASLDNFTAGAA